MKFQNMTNKSIISQAIAIAESHLTPDSYIMTLVANKNDWKYGTNMTGKDVAVRLCAELKSPINIYTYKPWYVFSAAIAYYDGKAIHFNIRKLSSDPHELAATLIHEWSHHVGFKHGNNYKTEDKCKFSVPYFLSENV